MLMLWNACQNSLTPPSDFIRRLDQEIGEPCLGVRLRFGQAAGQVGTRPSWSDLHDDPVHARSWRGLAKEEE